MNQFNTFPYGGAATAAKRLHAQLRNDGIDSRFLYHLCDREIELDSSYSRVQMCQRPQANPLFSAVRRRMEKHRQRQVHRRFDTHLAKREPGLEVFSMAELPEQTRLDWEAHSADAVHLHWISFLADFPSFFASIPNEIPVVWTLHDMNPMTGGCHYSDGCFRFKNGCGSCPQVVNSGPGDVSTVSFEQKKKALRHKRVAVVTPSQWLNDLARQSPVWPAGTTFDVIKLGFDLKQLAPVPKEQARQKLGIHTDRVLIGFGAEDIRNRRKGFQHLLSSLARLPRDQVECVVFGAGKIPPNTGLPEFHQMGFVQSLELQQLIYSASDFVVVPSREDNQPQVGLEAMACGTPVVGFDAGGIPEYVRPGETGLLAMLGDETDLARQMTAMVSHPELRQRMGAAARNMMEQEFEIAAQTRKYANLYRELTSASRRKAS